MQSERRDRVCGNVKEFEDFSQKGSAQKDIRIFLDIKDRWFDLFHLDGEKLTIVRLHSIRSKNGDDQQWREKVVTRW